MKTWQGDNPEPTVLEYEVTEFSKDPFDAAIFEIPEGYTQAGNMQAMAAQMATAAAGSKRAGMKRIGILAPSLIAAQLQGMIQSGYVEAVALMAPDQAQRMECDYILRANPAAVSAESAPASNKKGLLGAIAKATASVDTAASPTIAYRLVQVPDTSKLLNATKVAKTAPSDCGTRCSWRLPSRVRD